MWTCNSGSGGDGGRRSGDEYGGVGGGGGGGGDEVARVPWFARSLGSLPPFIPARNSSEPQRNLVFRH